MESGWSDSIDRDILKKWKHEAEVREKGHRKQEIKLRRMSRIGMVSSLIISGISAMGSVTLFDDCTMDPISYCDQYFELPHNLTSFARPSTCTYQKWARLGAGIMTAISTTAMGIREFLNLASKADAEKDALYQYSALARAIDELLSTPWDQRASPHIMIAHIREQYDHIVQASPTLPDQWIPDRTEGLHSIIIPADPDTPTSTDRDRQADHHAAHQPDVNGSHESVGSSSSTPMAVFPLDRSVPPSLSPSYRNIDTNNQSVLQFELSRLRYRNGN